MIAPRHVADSQLGRVERVALTLVGAILLVVTIASTSEKLRDGPNRWGLVAVVPLTFLAIGAYRTLSAVAPLGFAAGTLAGTGLIGAACVPETGQFTPLIATCAALAVIEVVTRRRLEPPWAVLAAGALLLWGLLYGAVGRPSAIIGALFAWWPLVLAGAVAWVTASRWHSVAAVVVGGIAAAVVARTGGVSDSGGPAARWAGAAALISTLIVIASLALPGGPPGVRPRLRRRGSTGSQR